MKSHEAYEWLVSHSKEIGYLDSMRSLLGWDQRTHIPSKGHAHRAAQLASLAGLLHSMVTDPKIGEMLDLVEQSDLVRDRLSAEAVNAREWRRAFDRSTKIPRRLAVELARTTAEGETAWEAAKPKNDWDGFKPRLERIVALKREEASILATGPELYDALLDEYEPGEKAINLESVFAGLREALVALLNRIADSGRSPDLSVVGNHFPIPAQEGFAREVIARLGYDLDAGRMDPSAHPFTVGIGPGDVRITTRYDEKAFSMAFFGAIHETGHALYDQGLLSQHWGTPLGQAVSLGIHESQSRTWENLVCRSLHFWKHCYPLARKYFPALKDVPLDAFYFAINNVRRSLIRTEADEVTYNLHVLLRFEVELALIRGDLEVSGLPEVWNEKMKAYLGISPPDFARGVMQDIHWSGGAIGYFPTYTLGNLYAAQFFSRARKDIPNLDTLFSQGDFSPFLDWLHTRIHAQGSRYLPRDLVRTVTSEDLNPGYLIDYLNAKFGSLYGC
jgi:carboxypeptidase Taq